MIKEKKWYHPNGMSLIIMKCVILKTCRGLMSKVDDVKLFLKELEKCFARNEKIEASTLLGSLVSMNRNIKEYTIEKSHLALKLKTLKLELFKNLCI